MLKRLSSTWTVQRRDEAAPAAEVSVERTDPEAVVVRSEELLLVLKELAAVGVERVVCWTKQEEEQELEVWEEVEESS